MDIKICFGHLVLMCCHLVLTCNFGPGCSFPCHCNNDMDCDELTGACPNGCAAGWSGDSCIIEDNIAQGKSASQAQSDTESGRTADKAVDGNTATDLDQCAATYSRDGPVWWRVDFGDIYRVFKIILYTIGAYENGKLLNFYLTNDTDSLDLDKHVLCRHFEELKLESFGRAVITCPDHVLGRSLVLYKNGPRLVVCEVQIRAHMYRDCSDCGTSSTHATSCNREYGCIAKCPKGKDQNSFCASDCMRSYGRNCRHECGRCEGGIACNPVNGSCPGGCQQWYTFHRCKQRIGIAKFSEKKINVPEVTSSSLNISWSRPNITSNVLEFYGYLVSGRSAQTNQKIPEKYLFNTNTGNHQSVSVENLTYNTEYELRVQLFRRHNKQREILDSTNNVTVKTSCGVPDPTDIYNYTVNSKWNGSIEIGTLFFTLGADPRCDTSENFIVIRSRTASVKSEIDVDSATFFLQFNSSDRFRVSVETENNEGIKSESNQLEIVVFNDQTGIPPPIPPDTPSTSGQVVVYVGAAVGVFLFACLLVLLCILVRKRKKRKTNKANGTGVQMSNRTTHTTNIDVTISLPPSEPPSSVERPPKGVLSKPVSPPVGETDESKSLLSIETIGDPDDPDNIYENRMLVEKKVKLCDLEGVIARVLSDPDCFTPEFEALPKGHMAMCEIGKQDENVSKNRFKNVLAYDHTRVILKNKPNGGYINANYIQGYGKREKHYIATQGPKAKTQEDFWELVWQENVAVIVVLTPIMENMKKQTEQYWPTGVGEDAPYGQFKVTMTRENVMAHYTHRVFVLSHKDKKMKLEHYHYLSWPDKNRPIHIYSTVDLINKVNNTHQTCKSQNTPIVVHCSAGIGRTGTYIALDILLRQAEHEDQVDVHSCVHLLRTQRVSLVQTLSQYVFLYEALLEQYQRGKSTIPVNSLCTMEWVWANTLPMQIKEEFKRVRSLTLKYDDRSADGRKPENVKKNRTMDIIPNDGYRPYLTTPSTTGNNYINAVLVDTFYKRDELVVTQVPLPETVEDFWRLVYDQECALIVLLDNLRKQGVSEYWPGKGQSDVFGNINVTYTSESQSDHDVHTFTLTNAKASANKRPHQVELLILPDWPTEGANLQNGCKQLIDIMSRAKSIQGKMKRPCKTLIQCLDGASKCGVYCAARQIFDRITTYQEVDVPMATHITCARRPQFLQDEKDYLLLYQLAYSYAERSQTYANL